MQLPDSLEPQLLRVSPPGLDDQDGRGRRRGGLRPAGRLPGPVLPRSRCGTRRVWLRAALLCGRRRGCANMPLAFCTAGSGGIGASSNWPGSWPASIPRRRPVAGRSSSWCTTISSRPGRGPCARRPSARSPTTPAGAISATPCPTRATGSGAGCWRVPLVTALGLLARCPGRGRQRLAAVSCSLEDHAPLHLHDARALARQRWSSPHGEPFSLAARLAEPDRLAARARASCSSASSTRSRPRCVTAATNSSCRRRSTRAGSMSRSAIPSSASGSSRRCGPS